MLQGLITIPCILNGHCSTLWAVEASYWSESINLLFSKVWNSLRKDQNANVWMFVLPSSILLPRLDFLPSSPSPSPSPPPLRPSVSFGGRYYVIVGGIEHRSRGSGGPMNYWWESRRDPPRPAHFTWSSPHCRVNQANGRERLRRERERERERSIVQLVDAGPPPSATELLMGRKFFFFFL